MNQILLAFLLLSFVITANAGALRCGGKLVATGDVRAKVLARCGKPIDVTTSYKEVGRSIRIGSNRSSLGVRKSVYHQIEIEKWTYNFGSNRLLYILTFENGKLVDVQTDNKGF